MALAGEQQVTPGVYSAVDLPSLTKLRDEQQRMIQESKEKAKVWAKHQTDYIDLKQKLSTIADKTTHQVMVPFGGKKAFFEGQLVHTNEIMVLLGDNWFVERSAKEAAEICDRRICRCNDMLQKLDQEIQLFHSWQDESNQLMSDSKLREIREPYNEKDEEEWRKKHRERVKAARLSAQKNSKSEEPDDEEENLWKLLDELEMEEDLKNELQAFADQEENQRQNTNNDNEPHHEDEHDESSTEFEIEETESDLSVTPDVSDDENAMEDIIRERERLREKLTASSSSSVQDKDEKRDFTEKTTSSSSSEQQPHNNKSRFGIRRRAVSFGEVSERLFSQEQDQPRPSFSTVTEEEGGVKNVEETVVAADTKVIEFDFLGPPNIIISTDNLSSKSNTTNNTPIHPGDLLRIYGPMKSPALAASKTMMSHPNEKKKAKKSILKAKSKYGGGGGGGGSSRSTTTAMAVMDSSSKGHGNIIPQLQSVPSPTKTTRFQTVKAVNDAVVEREVQERPTAIVPALTKMPMASSTRAISDSVVERKPSSAFNSSNSSSESAGLKPTATTQKLSRFRATRVHK